MKSFKKQIEQKLFYCQQITMLQLKRHSRVNLKYEKSNKLVMSLDITTIVQLYKEWYNIQDDSLYLLITIA